MNARARHHAGRCEQAAAMIEVLENQHPGLLLSLRDDPLGELGARNDIQVVLVAETTAVSGCSIAGRYDEDADPPALIVGAANSRRRMGFTVLHEYGHHLQRTNLQLGQQLFGVNDSEGLEEAACDEFAARVLLPDDLVEGAIDGRGPTASDVVHLYASSQASREACCVRAANLLGGAGAVLLLDGDGTVLFAAPRGMIPPARGSDQSLTPLIASALRRQTSAQNDETFVVYQNGGTSEHLYGQAAWSDRQDYLFAVLASDNVSWLPLALPRPNPRRTWYGTWWTCEFDACQENFIITEPPCDRCGQPRCGHGHCGCTVARARRDRTCSRCNLALPPTYFEGENLFCRDCA